MELTVYSRKHICAICKQFQETAAHLGGGLYFQELYVVTIISTRLQLI
jgi:hypothetical protein